jgi:hypothetical protein
VARLGEQKYKGSVLDGNPGTVLAQKIEMILEDLCPAYGLTKNSVNIEVEENSASDDEY